MENNGSFAGLCSYTGLPSGGVPQPQTYHASIQPMIDALTNIAGPNNVRCLVRTSNVPAGSTHFNTADSLETKNFGVAVYFNETHYAVDTTGVITLDKEDSGRTNWSAASDICAGLGKRLPSIEILKAINDYGAYAGNMGFLAGGYWSSTSSSSESGIAYVQVFNSGNVSRGAVANNGYVRCAS